MTSDRPHQPALEPAQALEELERGAGTQFDPDVVSAFREELGETAAPAAPQEPTPAPEAEAPQELAPAAER
jgi:HD-GYP domain-containing protein (c-di-GMP phosphodiesterase class II)